MASTTFFLSLLLTATATATATNNTTALTAPPTPPPITHPIISHKQAQQNTIIDAIIGATDFSNWANLLAGADISTMPLSATLFITVSATTTTTTKNNNNNNNNNNNPLLLPNHIVPRRLSFSELQLFPTGARLPTLLPGTTLRITNNSALNFTIDGGVKLIKPDLYQNAIVSVHGVSDFHESELRVSNARSRRGKTGNHHKKTPPAPPVRSVVSSPPMAVSAAVKGTCSWGQIVVVVFSVLLLLHILGLPSLEVGCSIVNGPAQGTTEGYFRYYAGCTWKFFD